MVWIMIIRYRYKVLAVPYYNNVGEHCQLTSTSQDTAIDSVYFQCRQTVRDTDKETGRRK